MITAVAHPNIALIKYWGKSNEELILPVTSSISVTLAAYETRTTVELLPAVLQDQATINGQVLEGAELKKITNFLNIIRQRATAANLSEARHFARVTSTNTVPTAAGLASSASGYAALAVAAATAYGLELGQQELSKLARRGSGSAARSLFGGFALWNAGEDDSTSYAEQLVWSGEPVEMIIGVISTAQKHTSSRNAMRVTAETSPFFDAWKSSNTKNVEAALRAIEIGDFVSLGELTEQSTMQMHAVMLSSNPSIRFLAQDSFELFDACTRYRNEGHTVYATADAGPNVKMICLAKDSKQILKRLQDDFPEIDFLISKIGGAPQVLEEQS